MVASSYEEFSALCRQVENESIQPRIIPLKEYRSEDATACYNSEVNAFSKFKKTLPRSLAQQSQWQTLQELCQSSKSHFEKFLQLTAGHDAGGIRKLRRSYGRAKGMMIDDGITTFRHVLDGREPQSLKDVFAFTCLSFVMSKLLQKNGRMEGVQVLADIDRWRMAIKRERDQHVYDEVVRIVWPEIEFLKQHVAVRKTALMFSTEIQQKNISTDQPHRETEEVASNLFSESSILDFGADIFSDSNEFEFGESQNSMNKSIDTDFQSSDNGLQDHLLGLLYETSTHDDFKFGDFLNLELTDSVAVETKPPVHQ